MLNTGWECGCSPWILGFGGQGGAGGGFLLQDFSCSHEVKLPKLGSAPREQKDRTRGTCPGLCQRRFRLDFGINPCPEGLARLAQLPRAVAELLFLQGFKSQAEIAEFTSLHSRLPQNW